MTVLVTGGCGFASAAVIRHAIRYSAHRIVNLGMPVLKAGAAYALEESCRNPRYAYERADVCDAGRLRAILAQHRPSAVMYLAAETQGDLSLDGVAGFLRTDVFTATLMQAVHSHFETLDGVDRDRFRFLYISTDEATGLPSLEDRTCETLPMPGSSPDRRLPTEHFAALWGHSFGLTVLTSHCANLYGPWQSPEMLVPLALLRARRRETLPVHGTGEALHDWLHVDDHAAAVWAMLEHGRAGGHYRIGGDAEHGDLEVVRIVCELMDQRVPVAARHARLIAHGAERPTRDPSAAPDAARLRSELRWAPSRGFRAGLAETVDWYFAHESWWTAIAGRLQEGRQRAGRLERAAS